MHLKAKPQLETVAGQWYVPSRGCCSDRSARSVHVLDTGNSTVLRWCSRIRPTDCWWRHRVPASRRVQCSPLCRRPVVTRHGNGNVHFRSEQPVQYTFHVVNTTPWRTRLCVPVADPVGGHGSICVLHFVKMFRDFSITLSTNGNRPIPKHTLICEQPPFIIESTSFCPFINFIFHGTTTSNRLFMSA